MKTSTGSLRTHRKTVIDLNVIISAALGDPRASPMKVLLMLHEGSIENFTSPRLKERLRSKLSSDKIYSFLREKFADETAIWRPLIAYDMYSRMSKVVNPNVLVEASPDPEDNELLSVAVCSTPSFPERS